MTMQYEYYIRRHEWSDSIALNVAGVLEGKRYHMQSPSFKTVEPGEALPAKPTLTLSRESAQLLMDDLYRIGIRPSDVGSVGQISAMQNHLNDMRQLIFGNGKKSPEEALRELKATW